MFIIGCGHVGSGEWQFRCFIADGLKPVCEAAIIDSWLNYMNGVQDRIAPGSKKPRIFHWSHAETSNLRRAYNAAVSRHPDRAASWSEPCWFDFLKQVMKAQPVTIKGALGFGLKVVAQAFYKHGLIQTKWESGPTDGLGAMVGAWRCAAECDGGTPLARHSLMREIAGYNEVDCRVMMEIVAHRRTHH